MADYIPLVMVRDTLVDVSVYSLPAPYGVRWYRPGDEAHWVALQAPFYEAGAITPDLFREQFGSEEALLRARLCFMLDAEGRPAGTVAAWLSDHSYSAEYGRIHWVAIHEAHQGRGLAKPLVGIALTRLRELGHTKAYLTTDAARPIAVRLYRSCGFTVVEQGSPDAPG